MSTVDRASLEKKTVKLLKEQMKEMGLDAGRLRKAELIDKILEASAAAEDSTADSTPGNSMETEETNATESNEGQGDVQVQNETQEGDADQEQEEQEPQTTGTKRKRSQDEADASADDLVVKNVQEDAQPQETGESSSSMNVESGNDAQSNDDGAADASTEPPAKKQKQSETETEPAASSQSLGTPTQHVYLENFVRPFTQGALNKFLSQNGEFESMWMDKMRTKCVVSFASQDVAEGLMELVNDKQWPEVHGKKLKGRFLSKEESDEMQSGGEQSSTNVLLTGALGDVEKRKREEREAKKQAQKQKKQEERERKQKEREEQKAKNTTALTTLFKITECEPKLYWLPNSAEQVEEARKALNAKKQEEEAKKQSQGEATETPAATETATATETETTTTTTTTTTDAEEQQPVQQEQVQEEQVQGDVPQQEGEGEGEVEMGN